MGPPPVAADMWAEIFQALKAMGWGGAIVFAGLFYLERKAHGESLKRERDRVDAMHRENVALMERSLTTVNAMQNVLSMIQQAVAQFRRPAR